MGKTVAKIIGYVLVLLLIAGAIGLAYRFTNGFNEDFKTFYIEYGGKQILTAESKMTLKKDKTYRFDVKYTFDKTDSEPKGYGVKILPNMTRDFDFTVDGEKYLFSKVGEITGAFDIRKDKTYFELTLPKDLSLESVLSKVYGKPVTVPSDAEMNNPCPYKLVISSYNEKVVYNILFDVSTDVIDITLDPSEIVFGGNEGQDKPETPSDDKITYAIDYDSLGWASTAALNLNCPGKAVAGEEVTFTATLKPEFANEYKISGINVNLSSGEAYIEDLQVNNGTYTFTMPDTATMEIERYITLMFYIIPVDM